jgi:hypothetical protein
MDPKIKCNDGMTEIKVENWNFLKKLSLGWTLASRMVLWKCACSVF